jgi:hypothetical protein
VVEVGVTLATVVVVVAAAGAVVVVVVAGATALASELLKAREAMSAGRDSTVANKTVRTWR